MKKELLEQIGSELTTQQNFVSTSFPSVYSKADVLHLLDSYTQTILSFVSSIEEQGPVMSIEGIQDLTNKLTYAINKRVDRLDSADVVDFDSASFSIGYSNTVEIDSIDYRSDTISEEVEAAIDEVLHDYFLTEAPEEETETA